MSERPENEAFNSLKLGRVRDGCEWPEPETSDLYRTLVAGAGRIIVAILGRRNPNLSREIATRALLHLRGYRGTAQFSTWFYRLARNEAIRSVTRGKPREEQFSADAEPLAPATGILFLPRGLTPEEKRLLSMVLRGETFEAIGRDEGSTRQAVNKRWQHLRKKLGEMYGRRD